MTFGRNKYSAKKTGGYDSKRELKRGIALRALEQAGQIFDLREQVRYDLIPKQMDGKKCAERAVYYVADFVYRLPSGETVVEDVKGMRTREYVIKRKLMRYIHNIAIKET